MTTTPAQRILIVEDNADLAFGLRNNLEIEGYAVDVASDGFQALELAKLLSPDLMILDLTLPGLDGYRVLRTLRDDGFRTPVLILSAHGEEADKVRGFRLGADDYVTKPFSLLELLARVQALLRRVESTPVDGGETFTYRFGDVVVDPARREVKKAGMAVSLTPREYDLLLALLRRNGAVLSRNELMREIWGFRHEVSSRTVDTHVLELRRKLEDDPTYPRYIVTVRKTGYRIEAEQ